MSPAQIEAIGRRHGQADDAIDRIAEAADALAECVAAEQDLEDGRAAAKQAAILRILTGTNPLNGKPHSASSAEAVVELDAEYADYRRRQRDAVVRTLQARGEYEAAKRRADLAVELVRVQREVGA